MTAIAHFGNPLLPPPPPPCRLPFVGEDLAEATEEALIASLAEDADLAEETEDADEADDDREARTADGGDVSGYPNDIYQMG